MIKATIGKEHFACTLSDGTRQIIADEPLDIGGKNLGFTPIDLLLSALGSCLAITLRMYIDRKEWDVDKIEVNVRMEEENTENVFYEDITCWGELTADQKQRIENVASKCPVAKILAKGHTIITKVL